LVFFEWGLVGGEEEGRLLLDWERTKKGKKGQSSKEEEERASTHTHTHTHTTTFLSFFEETNKNGTGINKKEV
jgi:hypothetical protein